MCPGSTPGFVIPPTRQGGCQVPRWGSEVVKRHLAGKSTVQIRRLGIAGLTNRLTRRCDKPTLYSNDPARSVLPSINISGGESLPVTICCSGYLVHGWCSAD